MIRKHPRYLVMLFVALAFAVASPRNYQGEDRDHDGEGGTATPIKHVVVIFQENISFDHYFATYPYAANSPGEPEFRARQGTPQSNNLLSGGLLDQNPNSVQPFRLDRSQALTCDQNHGYTAEQQAVNRGLMDKFPQFTGVTGTINGQDCSYGHGTGLVMGYYDGNTVTALWNYAQRYAMSDNFYGTMFGPSTVGALNLVAGTTSNATLMSGNPSGAIANAKTAGSVIGDPDPYYDGCSPASKTHVAVTGTHIGDLLNAKNLTWGWFQGGFAPTSTSNGLPVCGSTSTSLPGTVTDYVPHHNPFEYFYQSKNTNHLPPSSNRAIGKTDQANHQYDLSLFYTAVNQGNLPAVSFVKAKAFQNGHPGNSDPLDEQTFVITVVNAIQNSQYWNDTAVIVTYDDSDGWYDHQMDPVVNQSSATEDALWGPGSCGTPPDGATSGRCGYGPRLPLVVISRYAKSNYIDHRMTDQSSVIRFIEDNWGLGRIGGDSSDVKAGSLFGFFDFNHSASRIILNTSTGEVASEWHD